MTYEAHLVQLGRDLSQRCLPTRQDQHTFCDLNAIGIEPDIGEAVNQDRPMLVLFKARSWACACSDDLDFSDRVTHYLDGDKYQSASADAADNSK